MVKLLHAILTKSRQWVGRTAQVFLFKIRCKTNKQTKSILRQEISYLSSKININFSNNEDELSKTEMPKDLLDEICN